MKSSPYTSNALNLSDGPELGDNELGVHIIHVPLEFILEQRRLSMAGGPVGTVSLSEVARYIGQAEPTDIVVFDRQPLHFVGRPGHAKELRCHPQVHKDFRDSVLLVERAQNQSVVWWSETPLTDVTIAPSGKGHSRPVLPGGQNRRTAESVRQCASGLHRAVPWTGPVCGSLNSAGRKGGWPHVQDRLHHLRRSDRSRHVLRRALVVGRVAH